MSFYTVYLSVPNQNIFLVDESKEDDDDVFILQKGFTILMTTLQQLGVFHGIKILEYQMEFESPFIFNLIVDVYVEPEYDRHDEENINEWILHTSDELNINIEQDSEIIDDENRIKVLSTLYFRQPLSPQRSSQSSVGSLGSFGSRHSF